MAGCASPRSTFTPGWTLSASSPAINGLAAFEGLARHSAQLALLPGRRVTIQSCLEHVGEALDSDSASDCTTILAALAVRLH